MTYLHNPKTEDQSYSSIRHSLREGRPPRRRYKLPSKTKLVLLILAIAFAAIVISKPVSIWNAVWAFGATYVEGILGDNTVTTSEVQSVIFEEVIANEVLGEATRSISLTNVKVQVEDSDILGLGSESLSVAAVQIRARATVDGGAVSVKKGVEGFEIILPEATLEDVYMQIDEEILVERGRNLVTRLGDLVGGVTSEQLVRSEIAKVGQEAAESDTDLLRKAEEAATTNVTNLLSSVGIDNVSISFDR